MILFLAATSSWAVPFELNQQGRLFDGTGVPIGGTQNVTFTLYAGPTGPTVLWSETIPTLFDDGYYSARLGQDAVGNALDDTILDGSDAWLAVTVGGTETDRMPVVSVPYAYRANTAANVSGGTVDVSEILVNGSVVIDSSGNWQGTGGDGDTLGDLVCAPDQVASFDGAAWGCATDLDTDTDTLGALTCSAGQVTTFDGTDWTCQAFTADTLAGLSCSDGAIVQWSDAFQAWGCDDLAFGEITGLPADLADGSIDWAELTGIPADLADGSIDWAELTSIPADLADGSIDWAELTSVPADFSDGSIDWAELTGIPADLADGSIDWAEVTGIPGDIADGDADDWSEIANIPADFADGSIAWSELTGIPADIADGDDDTVVTSLPWASITGIPADIADGDDDTDTDTQLTDAEVDAFVENGDLDISGKVNTGNARSSVSSATTATKTGATYTDIPGLSTTVSTRANAWLLVLVGVPGVGNTGGDCSTDMRIVVDGSQVGSEVEHEQPSSGTLWTSNMHALVQVAAAGNHTVSAQWSVQCGTAILNNNESTVNGDRTLSVIEL